MWSPNLTQPLAAPRNSVHKSYEHRTVQHALGRNYILRPNFSLMSERKSFVRRYCYSVANMLITTAMQFGQEC